jgi:uncharacterized protein DUF4169
MRGQASQHLLLRSTRRAGLDRSPVRFACMRLQRRVARPSVARCKGIQATMADIVNLRRVRKAKARSEKEADAEANRAQHGIAKPVRDLAKARKEKAKHDIDAHKLNDDE